MISVKVQRTCEGCGYSDSVMARQLTEYPLEQLRLGGRAYVACPNCGPDQVHDVMNVSIEEELPPGGRKS